MKIADGHPSPRKLLSIYLNDHLAGAQGGAALSRRIAHAYAGTSDAATTATLAADIADDRDALLAVMRDVGVPRRPEMRAAGLAAERLGRLKRNGTLLRRSPLSGVLELEVMLIGVTGKRAGWLVLRDLCGHEPRLDIRRIDALIVRADQQLSTIETLRLAAAHRALRP